MKNKSEITFSDFINYYYNIQSVMASIYESDRNFECDDDESTYNRRF